MFVVCVGLNVFAQVTITSLTCFLFCPLQPSSSCMLCCAVLCCAVLCCAVLCCAVLCCAVHASAHKCTYAHIVCTFSVLPITTPMHAVLCCAYTCTCAHNAHVHTMHMCTSYHAMPQLLLGGVGPVASVVGGLPRQGDRVHEPRRRGAGVTARAHLRGLGQGPGAGRGAERRGQRRPRQREPAGRCARACFLCVRALSCSLSPSYALFL